MNVRGHLGELRFQGRVGRPFRLFLPADDCVHAKAGETAKTSQTSSLEKTNAPYTALPFSGAFGGVSRLRQTRISVYRKEVAFASGVGAYTANMTVDFSPLGRAVDSGRLQTALGFNRARLNKLVTQLYDRGVGAALPRPVGVLGGSMVWDVKDLERALPAILAAQSSRNRFPERIEREPVDFDELAKHREVFESLPHVLGFMDAAIIAEAFGLGEDGARYPGEWAARGKLLPPHAGVIGIRRVWDVQDVKAHEPLIRRHLHRRRDLAGG